MRQRDGLNGASCLAQAFDRGFHRGAHLGIEAIAKVLSRHTDAQALHRLLESLSIIRYRYPRGGGIQRIMSCDHAQHNGCVPHGTREGTDTIQRGSKRDQAITRHTSVGREQANDPTE